MNLGGSVGKGSARNQPCWCGSGKKYKVCHLRRESQPPPTLQRGVELLRQRRADRVCLHPQAGPSACVGKIVNAHSVSRAAGLKRIAEAGKVVGFRHGPDADRSGHYFRSMSTKTASTFTGFCQWHDKQLFAPLEDDVLEPTPEQVALLGFRSTARELYQKRGVLSEYEDSHDMDRGLTPPQQAMFQATLAARTEALRSGIRLLESLYERYAKRVDTGQFADIEFLLLEFDIEPVVLNSSQWHVEFDCRGNLLQDLSRLWVPFESVSLEFLVTSDQRQACLLSWIGASRTSRRLAQSLLQLSDRELPSAVMRLLVLASENCFFRPSWWEAIGGERRRLVNSHFGAGAERTARELMAFFCDHSVRMCDWPLAHREVSGSWHEGASPGPTAANTG